MSLISKIAALACATALAACGSPTVYGVYYSSGYSPTHPQLAAADGIALAVIRANPFTEDRDNAAILADMQGRNPGYKLYFAQTSRPEARYDYKVILTFGSQGMSVVNPCLDTGPLPPAPRTGRIDVRADFCVGSSFLSETRGSVDGVQRADDPRVAQLVGAVMSDLLSDRYMDQGDRCGMADC
jgi:hypothetical protein